MLAARKYLVDLGVPDGFRTVRQEELEPDLIVHLWGSHQGKHMAYGPHIYKGITTRHSYSPLYQIKQEAYFSHPLSELLVVSTTVRLEIDNYVLVLKVDGEAFDVKESTVFARDAQGYIIGMEEGIRQGSMNTAFMGVLYNLCVRLSMGHDLMEAHTREEIRLTLNRIRTTHR